MTFTASASIGDRDSGELQMCQFGLVYDFKANKVASQGESCTKQSYQTSPDSGPWTFLDYGDFRPQPPYDPFSFAEWKYVALNQNTKQVAFCFIIPNVPKQGFTCLLAQLK